MCTALATFDGVMADHPGLKGLTIREGDVIYVLRMADCPNGFWMVSSRVIQCVLLSDSGVC